MTGNMSRRLLAVLLSLGVSVSPSGCPQINVLSPLCCDGDSGGLGGVLGDKLYREGHFSADMAEFEKRLAAIDRGITRMESGTEETLDTAEVSSLSDDDNDASSEDSASLNTADVSTVGGEEPEEELFDIEV